MRGKVEKYSYAIDYPTCPHGERGTTCWYGREMNNRAYKCARFLEPKEHWTGCYIIDRDKVHKP